MFSLNIIAQGSSDHTIRMCFVLTHKDPAQIERALYDLRWTRLMGKSNEFEVKRYSLNAIRVVRYETLDWDDFVGPMPDLATAHAVLRSKLPPSATLVGEIQLRKYYLEIDIDFDAADLQALCDELERGPR